MLLSYPVNEKNLREAWEGFIKTRKLLPDVWIRPEIKESWERCHKLNVDPYNHRVVKLSGKALGEIIHTRNNMIDIAKPYMKSLYSLVEGSGFVVTLCDEKGNLLELLGDKTVLEDANGINLVPGVNWSEKFMGTTAIGIVLEIDTPIQVCSAEHYCVFCHEWTCSAAPIHDHEGHLIGVLNMSGNYTRVHSHTLGMVVAAAQAIGQQLKAEQFAENLIVNNKYLKTILETMSDGVISVNHHKQVTHINSVAARMFDLDQDSVSGNLLPDFLSNQFKLKDVLGKGASSVDREISFGRGKPHCTVTVKPIIQSNKKIAGAVITLREIKTVRRMVNRLIGPRALFTFEDILTNSREMKETIELGKIAARNDFTILITGESGTGKELMAQAIHNESSRCNGPFVAINCAAVPKELIGSEMFGYTEGAFTGAKSQGSIGKFELADGGTIFLDEIGDMPLDMQAALLRVIQEREIVRIGGANIIPINVRIIAASNKNLPKEVERGNFRHDLFYRLNEFPIYIPTLSERAGDVSFLAKNFLQRFNKKLNKNLYFSQQALVYLEGHGWPGNVRELENLIQQVAYLKKDGVIEQDFIQALIVKTESKKPGDGSFSLMEKEKEALRKALWATNGNVSEAAKLLGIGRTTLYRKIQKYKFDNLDCITFKHKVLK